MKKLSESQRLCLVHAAIGELHYAKGGWSEHYFSHIRWITPFKQQSRVGASVAKMGYFDLPNNITGSGYVTLSDSGRAKFEEVVTEEERQKIDEHKRTEARYQLEREAIFIPFMGAAVPARAERQL